MRMGIIAQRRKKERAARLRRRLMIAAGILLLSALAMSPQMHERIAALSQGIQTFGESIQGELTLEEMEVYALQLAVFDSGERAAQEAKRLQAQGVRCVVWQRERMRIVADAAFSREALSGDAAQGNDAYVIRETLPGVALRLTADAKDLEAARQLLEMPDRIFREIAQDEGHIAQIIADVRPAAEAAIEAHPENALYTQLAQSLVNWCRLMENAAPELSQARLRSYAAVTICTLCRELRLALENQAESAASTASAQRTPSTAAEVMPPA